MQKNWADAALYAASVPGHIDIRASDQLSITHGIEQG
jgi:hypothetical protein